MDTNKLIDDISKDLKPVKNVGCCPSRCFLWGLFSLAYVAIIFVLMGGHEHEEMHMFHSTSFLIEIILINLAAFSALLATLQLSRPDTKVRRITYGLIGSSTLIWVGILIYNLVMAVPESLQETFVSLQNIALILGHCCVLLGVMIIIPTLALFYMMKKSAPVHLGVTGYAMILTTSSFAALGMRFWCATGDHGHLLVLHFIPVFILSLIGVFLGRILLRW